MNLLAALVLAVAAMAFVAYPLFKKPEEALAAEGFNPRRADLNAAHAATLAALDDAEFEHKVGNLSDADYAEVRAGLQQTVQATQASLAAAPRPSRAAAPPAARKGGARPQERTTGACPHCGQPALANDKFCRRCGKSLGLVCPACGEPYTSADQFCAGCGARLQGGRRG